jgi:predicted small lipoprotein YifL
MKVYNLLALLCVTPLLYSCGQMGPLYLPGTPPPIHTGKEEVPQSTDTKKAEPAKSTPSQTQ